ncbi:MAG: 50S ribosomal protein L20 [Clostridia bacterium]
MARVKGAVTTRARHKKVLKRAKGYYGAKSIRFRMANQAVMKSLKYSYVGRKHNKRNFRRLWIARINAGTRMCGTTYSKFMADLKGANITINRKMLAEMAVNDMTGFKALVEKVQK